MAPSRWRLAAKNLARNPRRAWATGVSVALGIAGVLIVSGFIRHLELWLEVSHIYTQHHGHISVYKRGGLDHFASKPAKYGFTRDEQSRLAAALRTDAAVERHGFILSGNGLVSNGCRTLSFVALGCAPELEQWIRSRPELRAVAPSLSGIRRGRGPWERSASPGMLVGMTEFLTTRLGKTRLLSESTPGAPEVPGVLDCDSPKIVDELARDSNVQLLSSAHDGSLAVADADIAYHFTTGYEELETDAVQTTLAALQDFYATERVTYLAVFLRSSAQRSGLHEYARALQARFTAAGLDVEVYPFDDPRLSPTLAGGSQFLGALGNASLAIMLLLVGITLSNSVALAASELSREFAVLRAVGYRSNQVVDLQVRETILAVSIACIGGIGLATAAALALNAAHVETRLPGLWGTQPLCIEVDALTSAGIVVAFMLVSVAACYWASWRLMRRPPLELLAAS